MEEVNKELIDLILEIDINKWQRVNSLAYKIELDNDLPKLTIGLRKVKEDYNIALIKSENQVYIIKYEEMDDKYKKLVKSLYEEIISQNHPIRNDSVLGLEISNN